MIRHLCWLPVLPLVCCAPLRAQEAEFSTATVLASTTMPETVLPHCLFGLDPHDQAVQPWPKGPEPSGYRIDPSTPLHLLTWLGFARGDILTAVNGSTLGTAEHHYLARQSTHGADSCSWTVQRGEQRGEVRTKITPADTQDLVLERDSDGLPVRLSRAAVWRRLSNPYAFGRYPSVMAMAADDGVYAVDKGVVSLMTDLGFQPLDHHLSIGGVSLTNGQRLLEGVGHLLTDRKVRWEFRRSGELQTITIVIEGDSVALPGWGDHTQGPVLPKE
jgi:hypothetical protein